MQGLGSIGSYDIWYVPRSSNDFPANRAEGIRTSGTDLSIVEHSTFANGTSADLFFTNDQVSLMKSSGKTVIAYMSVSSIDSDRQFYNTYKATLGARDIYTTPGTNEKYIDYWSDGTDGHPLVLTALKEWLKLNFDAGYDGVFLDVFGALFNENVEPSVVPGNLSAGRSVATAALLDIGVELDKYAQSLALAAGRPEFKLVMGSNPSLIEFHRAYSGIPGYPVRQDLITEFQSRIDGVLVESLNFLNPDTTANDVLKNLTGADKATEGFGGATLLSANYIPAATATFTDGSDEAFLALETILAAGAAGFVPYAVPISSANVAQFQNAHFFFNRSTNRADAILLSASNPNGASGGGSDLIVGHSGVNTINAGDGNDRVRAEAGDDVVNGGGGNDTIDGGGGNDTLSGEAGNDVITGGAGNDTANGGDGVDQFIIAALSTAFQIVGEGNGVFRLVRIGGTEVDRLSGIESVKFSNAVVTLSVPVVFNGTPGPDVRDGSPDNDLLSGAGGNDTLNGLAGNDVLNGGDGNDALNGGDGNDVIDGGAGIDQMTGGLGNDTFYVNLTTDIVLENVNGGIDTVYSIVSNNAAIAANVENLFVTGVAQYGRGNGLSNWINGNSSINRLYGGDGNDLIAGGDGNDFLYGEAGDDTLDGGNGNDRMEGGAGNDIYNVNSQTDSLAEVSSAGVDLVRSTAGWTLGSFFENLTLVGTASVQGIGNALANVIVGNQGSNLLYGAGGNDTLTGGGGPDRFDFRGYGAAFGVDTVTDFRSGIDVLYVDASAFPGLFVGDEVYVQSGASPLAVGTVQQFLFDTTTKALSFDRDGIGAIAPVQFATLTGVSQLFGYDLVLY